MRIPLHRKTAVITLVIVSVLLMAGMLFTRTSAKAPEYVTAPAAIGSIRTAVNATGTIQPVVTVQVGSQISGQVQELYADFNSVVKRGQLLARIDARNSQAQVENATAAVSAAQAQVRNAQAGFATREAEVRSAQSNLEAANVDRNNTATFYDRATELSQKGLVSKNDFDTAKANADTAKAKYVQAEAAVQQAKAQQTASVADVDQARAQLARAQADLNQARVNLGYTNIYSPVDGVVISRNVDVGQTIAASLQSPTLFTIANDLTRMAVNASVDEADIGKVAEGAEVTFTVDAYPQNIFKGQVQEIRLNPSTVQNVVTYGVILNVDNSELKLKPGMTANTAITVDRRDRVLTIPNAALRYTPPGMQRKPISAESITDEEAGSRNEASEAAEPELAPGQKWDAGGKVRQTRAIRRVVRSGEVWVLSPDGTSERRSLVLGVTDGVNTEVVSGQLQAGDAVITGENTEKKASPSQPATPNPFLSIPRMPGGGRRR
jgi:HlyD family secretion protein